MHFPDNPDWQLLDRKQTIEQFIDSPVVKSYLFQYGLQVPPNSGSTIGIRIQQNSVHFLVFPLPGCKLYAFDANVFCIDSDNGSIEISLRRTSRTPLSFSYRLECEEEILDGYCIHHFYGLTPTRFSI